LGVSAAGVLGFEASATTAGCGVAGLSSTIGAGVRGLGDAATGVADLEDLADLTEATDLLLLADLGGPALDGLTVSTSSSSRCWSFRSGGFWSNRPRFGRLRLTWWPWSQGFCF